MRLPTPREPECSMNQTSVLLVEADLDEVVAGAERSEVVHRAAAADLRMLGDDLLVAGAERLPTPPSRAPSARSRHAPVDLGPPLSVRPCGTAASIAERSACRLSGRSRARASSAPPPCRSRCRRRPPPGMIAPSVGNHAPDRRAVARVHVGHHRDPLVNEGQCARRAAAAPAPRPRRARRWSRP